MPQAAAGFGIKPSFYIRQAVSSSRKLSISVRQIQWNLFLKKYFKRKDVELSGQKKKKNLPLFLKFYG